MSTDQRRGRKQEALITCMTCGLQFQAAITWFDGQPDHELYVRHSKAGVHTLMARSKTPQEAR